MHIPAHCALCRMMAEMVMAENCRDGDGRSSDGSSDKNLWRIEQPADIESGRMRLMEICKSRRQEQCDR